MVEWKTLNDICSKITDGSHFSPQSVEAGYYMPSVKDMKTNGFDYVSCKQISEEDYMSLIKTGCKPRLNDVLVAKDGSILKYVFPVNKEEDIVVLSSIAILSPKQEIAVSSYLSYYLLRSDVKEQTIREYSSKGGVPRIILKNFKKIRIPLPSIPEQHRIVGILDTFTASIDNLKEQIALRRKQYEYYRDQLLDLEGKEGVEVKTLGDVGDICMCKRIMKEQTSDNGDIPFFKIGTFGGKADAFISRTLFEEYKSRYSYPKKGEILISASGTIGRSVVFNGEDAYFQDSNIVWIANDEKVVTNRFLYYFYQVAEWKTDGGTIKRLYNYNLKNTTIPVPSLSEQQRIVDILDKFEASIQNLEAQLSQREKQYEYYRNKLLTFE